ncbi:acetylornithine transaminase [Corynebacterium uropygiale]|uniref:Acetylornithine aminotransferase n=1 Tax=Corynebacterium uropygiale TaxID=1775911 RepID=A0A9X1QRX8_9CORY|nr:acetylornithine transaminase [Corynebacterium uropygiale]MCF4007060.1 acetylornithine transaminase [Corynebacterium uropygiale]
MSDTAQQWAHDLMNTYGVPPLTLVKGEGARVLDDEGREYIDLLAGIAVNSLGHAHPAVIDAVSSQVAELAHVSNLFVSQPVVDVAHELKARFLRGKAEADTRVFFCNSGAEANEAAFKLARLTGKSRVLAAVHGFHGRTMGSLSLTGQPDKQKPFLPLVPGVEFFDFNDCDSLSAAVAAAPEDTAAIIVEPIQGETGVIPATRAFLETARHLCDEHGILLIFDEVQTGVGRTGQFFAHETYGVTPDVVTMAKGLGAGLPIGACLATGPAASLFGPGSHGTTFGGNPVACAAARAVLQTIDEDFLAGVRARSEQIAAGLADLPGVDYVRGRGLMLGVVLKNPLAKEVVAAGYRHGLILNAPAQDVVRITPPLVITAEDVDEAITRFAAALEDATKEGDE